jgi:hypothetical protein
MVLSKTTHAAFDRVNAHLKLDPTVMETLRKKKVPVVPA